MGTDIHGVFQARKDDKWIDVPSDYDQDRHYLLFAWLGGVRNGYGCAGCKTHTPITPLSDCRGVPDGFDMEGDSHPISTLDVMDSRRRKWHEDDEPLEIWMGDHSHSWVTAEEVISTEPPRIKRSGIVTRHVYDAWGGAAAPESWCGGISGPNIVVSDRDDFDVNSTHIRIEWEEDAGETLAYFIDEMKRLTEKHGEVRFVFGFSS